MTGTCISGLSDCNQKVRQTSHIEYPNNGNGMTGFRKQRKDGNKGKYGRNEISIRGSGGKARIQRNVGNTGDQKRESNVAKHMRNR